MWNSSFGLKLTDSAAINSNNISTKYREPSDANSNCLNVASHFTGLPVGGICESELSLGMESTRNYSERNATASPKVVVLHNMREIFLSVPPDWDRQLHFRSGPI
jgi:hypothetical protein